MDGKTARQKLLMPSLMIITAGLLLGAAVGPGAQLTGSIGAVERLETPNPSVNRGLPMTSSVTAGFTGPSDVVEGQNFMLSVSVSADDPLLGAVFELTPTPPGPEAPCEVNGFEVTGGMPLGNNIYAILPQISGLEQVEMIPQGQIRFSWKAEAAGLGACTFAAEVRELNIAKLPEQIQHTVDVVPDISTISLYLGHVKTIGGMAIDDEAKTITPPQGDVVVETISPYFIAFMTAAISHDDGMSWGDTGKFSVTPGVGEEFLDAAGLHADYKWSMTLADDGDIIDPWLTLGLFDASPEGTPNLACLSGTYSDSGDAKGSKTQCLTVTGIQNADLSIGELRQPLRSVVEGLLARTGHAFVPSGAPNHYYYFEDLERSALFQR